MQYFSRALLILLLILGSLASAQVRKKTRSVESVAKKDNRIFISQFSFYIPYLPYKFETSYYLVKSANAGDPFAQEELGFRYMLGDGFEIDSVKGIYWIKRAAEQDLPTANYNLGVFYNTGFLNKWNPFVAFSYYHKAAEYGMTQAEFAIGIAFTEDLVVKRNLDSAFYWVKRSAGKGYPPAKSALERLRTYFLEKTDSSDAYANTSAGMGLFFRDTTFAGSASGGKSAAGPIFVFMDIKSDTSVIPSDSAVFMQMIKSEPEGYLENLGLANFSDSLPFRAGEIMAALLKAGYAGSPEANLYLGKLYEKGVFVKADVIKAALYYIRAFRLESPLSRIMLGHLLDKKGNTEYIAKMADKKNPDALFVFAALNSLGFNSQLTNDVLLKYLQDAAKRNNIAALLEMGQLAFTGRVGETDSVYAYSAWALAHSLDAKEGMIRIITARIASGGTCTRDELNILHEADKLGSILAQSVLGLIYERGIGVSTDKKTAIMYFRKAGYRGSSVAMAGIKRMYEAAKLEIPAQ